MAVGKKEINRLGSPYDDCRHVDQNENMQRNFYADHFSYSRSACLKTCRQMWAMLVCDCCLEELPCNPMNVTVTPTGHTLPSHVEICAGSLDVACRNTEKGKSFLSECQDGCHSRCSDVSYDVSLSSGLWPNIHLDSPTSTYTVKVYPDDSDDWISDAYDKYRNIAGATNTIAQNEFKVPLTHAMKTHYYQDYRLDHLRVNIYLSSLDVQKEIFSPKYDWSAFMSNLGGTMGLFIGFSLLSFMELVELFIDLCGQLVSVVCRRLCNATVSPTG